MNQPIHMGTEFEVFNFDPQPNISQELQNDSYNLEVKTKQDKQLNLEKDQVKFKSKV